MAGRVGLFLAFLTAAVASAETVYLNDLDLKPMRQGYGTPQVNRSIREQPLKLAGKVYEKGVGSHARSELWLALDGQTERFQATIGVDDNANGAGTVVFQVWADGKRLYDSGVMKPGDAPKDLNVDLRGAKNLLLLIGDAGDGIGFDHGDYCDARFTFTGAPPKPVAGPDEEPVILTPPPGPAPRLNSARRYGCRPGHPFLYRIPCQGSRPIAFAADSLPAGLTLDAATGILRGTTPPAGEYKVVLHAQNAAGKADRPFTIVAGDTLALTPPMGWNDWYAHFDGITDALMRQAADLMIQNGMADVGYDYVDIDDCWMTAAKHRDPKRQGALRAADGTLLPNQHFPDMKGLAEYIHSKGLKAGLYTSPGPTTCAGFAGAWQHEAQDAKTFADWGFDLLKYDWCSYGDIAKGDGSLVALKKPYQLMGELLRQQPRDIQLNLCQYGMGNVWEWGAEVGGQSWRTAGDLGFELSRIVDVALRNCEHRAWNKPGCWNDPDYLQIGNTGPADKPRPFGVGPNESYCFMSLWSLMASPLFYSGDMGSLDAFTLNVLTNAEVIEVNQDPLGQCAAPALLNEQTFLLVKDLADGGKAVGLFNRSEFPLDVTAPWAVIGVHGPRTVRDLWRQKDLGTFDGEFKTHVARHGVVLVKVLP